MPVSAWVSKLMSSIKIKHPILVDVKISLPKHDKSKKTGLIKSRFYDKNLFVFNHLEQGERQQQLIGSFHSAFFG